jgi:type I restriction enzyme M protein
VPQQGQEDNGEEPSVFGEVLWTTADKLRGSIDVTEYKHVVLGLFFLRYLGDAFEELRGVLRDELAADGVTGKQADGLLEQCDQYTAKGVFWAPPEARWGYLREHAKQPEIGELIDSAMDLIECGNPGLRGMLPKAYGRLGLNIRTLGELIDLISGIGPGAPKHREEDIHGRVYEFLLGRFVSAEGRRGGEFYTAHSVVRLLVEMIEPYSGRVYDPCCGSGGMFVQVERFARAHAGHGDDSGIYGQEVDDTAWRLAQMNLTIRGVEANLGPRGGDSLHEDLHPDLKADYILANPPFNISGWGGDQLCDDARWRYGAPPVGNANFAWLQHIVSHLSPHGVAGVVLANGSVSSQQSREAEIRRRMIEADLVECIVALPAQLFYSTPVPVTLWFLNRDKSSGGARHRRNRRSETLFIDARNLGVMVSRRRRELTDNDRARIVGTYRAWRGEPDAGGYVDVPGFCVSATTERIAEHRYVLMPSRYVGAAGMDEAGEPLDAKIHVRHGQCVRVSLQGSRAGFLGLARQPPSFLTVVPGGCDVATWCTARYGRLGRPPEVTVVPDIPPWSHIDPMLEEQERKIRQTLKAVGWPASRLVNFVKNAEYLRSQKSSERTVIVAKFHNEERLVLPIEPHFDAAYGTVHETVIANRCLLISLLSDINGSFLAAWLNSDDGRRIRAAAMPEPGRSPRTMSSENLLRFLDGLIMPVPGLDIQASIADTTVILHRARQRAGQLLAELWQAPSRAAEIQSATRYWLDSTLPPQIGQQGPERAKV